MSQAKSQIANALIRLLISFSASLCVASFLIYSASRNYWDRTIFRTQTVDFNILSHIIGNNLSLHLIENNSENLQKIIDSNYGLFGIVITDCKNEKQECMGERILYLSGGEVQEDDNGSKKYVFKKRPRTWQQNFSEEQLKNSLYIVLRNPPPLDAEWELENTRATDPTPLEHSNTGQIIGRAYLLRNPSPGFISDMQSWIRSPFQKSASNLIFNSIVAATLFTGLLAWLIFEILFYKKQILETKRQEAEQKLSLQASEILEAEKQALISKNKLQEEEQRRLKAENEELRIKSLWEGFHEAIDKDFTSVIANRLQELQGFFYRLNTNIDNIVHDFHKAPLLSINENTPENRITRLKDNLDLIIDLDKEKREIVINAIISFFRNTDRTINSIKWVIDDLSQVANLNSSKINLQSTISNFLSNQPPSASSSDIKVTFDTKSSEPIYIFSNEWHLKSIIKNVLYNCRTAIMKYDLGLNDDIEFEGKIDIICSHDEDNAYITILDNGSGYPSEIMDKLYQTGNRVNLQRGNGKGSIIVYSYLRLHSGKAYVENRQEGGGKVTFSFPLLHCKELDLTNA